MVEAEPTQPAPRAARIARRRPQEARAGRQAAPDTLAEVAAGLSACRRCGLWRDATQAAPGEGPAQARLMLVGEQPGDAEDLSGRPFVGPAGFLLDRALGEAGIDRAQVFVTNAVKHFKHELRGRRRLHETPGAAEVQACRFWLDRERRLVAPRLIVTLGATALTAVLGRPAALRDHRGSALALEDGGRLLATVHPAHLLRLPDETVRREAYAGFVADLRRAVELAGSPN